MLIKLITAIEDLPPVLAASVSPEERSCVEKLRTQGELPFAVTPHFASLAGPEQNDPIRRQCFPNPAEFLRDPFALEDPLGEALYRVTPRLVHQYRDRCLLLAGGPCAGYCRFCFRRVRMSRSPSFISAPEIEQVCRYLKNHAEVRELLVSGGDPLTAEDSKLAGLFRAIREARPGILIRICTRVPIAWPQRLTPETLRLFVGFKPLRMMVHINHPRELAEESRRVLAGCADQGIPVHVQTVLLRGVNDNAGTLALLFRECLDLGLSPYYLFQPDLAPGTAHFRLPLKEGLALYKELQTLISGLGLPAYAVDLPGGGSKIRLNEGSIAGETQTPAGRAYLLKAQDGKLWPYPAD